jgi:hypothetical protein
VQRSGVDLFELYCSDLNDHLKSEFANLFGVRAHRSI